MKDEDHREKYKFELTECFALFEQFHGVLDGGKLKQVDYRRVEL